MLLWSTVVRVTVAIAVSLTTTEITEATVPVVTTCVEVVVAVDNAVAYVSVVVVVAVDCLVNVFHVNDVDTTGTTRVTVVVAVTWAVTIDVTYTTEPIVVVLELPSLLPLGTAPPPTPKYCAPHTP